MAHSQHVFPLKGLLGEGSRGVGGCRAMISFANLRHKVPIQGPE